MEVVAVLNDTTGTLLAGSYLDKQCYIGLIMGMHRCVNPVYLETVQSTNGFKLTMF